MTKIIAALVVDGFIESPSGELDWVETWEVPFDLVPQIDTFSEYRGYASRLREGTARRGRSIVANADSDKYASQA
jgi:hypothetical protein